MGVTYKIIIYCTLKIRALYCMYIILQLKNITYSLSYV